MNENPQISEAAQLVRRLVRDSVGAFFRNTYAPGTLDICSVCRAPANGNLCDDCRSHRADYGNQLADRTILLTYAQGKHPGGPHQSAHVVRAYKGYFGTPASPECQEYMKLMVRVAAEIHRPCFEGWLGISWDSLTFIPSRERPDASHPVAALARAVESPDGPTSPLDRFLLETGPGAVISAKHQLVEDRFLVPEKWRSAVDGKNVLIVDDTWTRGASAQGAAIAAKQAGAATVTVLCVSRWLNWNWAPNERLLSSLAEDYNALLCPVTGQVCQSAINYRA
ncbi:hypothetical protein [Nocardia pseudobrasiliensis]|uniref:Putative amidophosphoribosyltransferase n=1 Tax=Nocardia pseudobrasiliensis TaxID=45979 RepID=A0A370I4Q3_9NOCA|nr:hypothetical protein [Nocardia pseudobrasiliensis]RDI65728.1 putative amidophosphoribosyltransferase [Nocardia pseudobrasiliensis]